METILIKVIDSIAEEEDIQSDPTADFGQNEEEVPYQATLIRSTAVLSDLCSRSKAVIES